MPPRFCIHYVSKSGRPNSGHRTGKGPSSSQFPRRVVLKNVLAIRPLYSSPMLVRSCLKYCKLGFSIMWTKNFQTSKLGLKRKNQRLNCKICWIIEKAREFQRNIYLCFIDYAKVFNLWTITNCGKLLKRWEYQSIRPVSWETCMRVKKWTVRTLYGTTD